MMMNFTFVESLKAFILTRVLKYNVIDFNLMQLLNASSLTNSVLSGIDTFSIKVQFENALRPMKRIPLGIESSVMAKHPQNAHFAIFGWE